MNHIWLRHFGQPIVPTVYDFGAGGREPTHPALLDWLAAEFMAHGWSMKAMHRLICTSSAYRMASTDDPAQSSHDPDNLFLWRMPARRLVERGVRFVQLFHGYTGSAGAWDSHTNLKTNHTRLCKQIDQPIAGLIKHLKQRGMLDETMVVLGSEFGRTPGVDLLKRKVGTGRDHHPHGFTVMMAGGGVHRPASARP